MSTATHAAARPAGPVPAAAAAALLAVAAAAVGAVGWPVPERITSGWQVAGVAPSLLAAVVGTAVVCLVVAAAAVRPGRLPGPLVPAAWWALAGVSTAALTWNALYSAALGGDDGPVIPVFSWAFTFVPALAAGLICRAADRRSQVRAAVGTGVVTLPLLTLGWALLEPDGGWSTVLSALYAGAVLGIVPLALAVLLGRVLHRRRG